ncbi:Hypothetical predicted protein [Mytilus galloprovincialis]|uniref:Uncharacterized protein n=1 Tax=Mytilus galloprovincialis TaxID=29158 RepID=A0A8B6D197_MYTGA|nr:Hypothetical predicted protein [Mytilus galloprovincialis]
MNSAPRTAEFLIDNEEMLHIDDFDKGLERRARSINTSNVDTNEEDGVEQPREVRPTLRLLNDHSDSIVQRKLKQKQSELPICLQDWILDIDDTPANKSRRWDAFHCIQSQLAAVPLKDKQRNRNVMVLGTSDKVAILDIAKPICEDVLCLKRKQRVASKNLQAKKRVKPLQVEKKKRKGSGRVGSTAEKDSKATYRQRNRAVAVNKSRYST